MTAAVPASKDCRGQRRDPCGDAGCAGYVTGTVLECTGGSSLTAAALAS